MNVSELTKKLHITERKLPVCYFDSKTQEYFEIEDDGSIEKVWDDNSGEWILSLNENDESLRYRLRNCSKYENYP
jgi:hypothetical protein